jgi:hypothetical protein
VCVCLGFVVLVFLEESKEWGLAFGDVWGGKKKKQLRAASLVCFFSLVYNLCGFFILLDGVFSYMLVD